MTSLIRYWAVIPAAGTSKRMQSKTPKQYLSLNSNTVIESSLDCFLQNPNISNVIVALCVNDQYWNRLAVATNKKIHTVIGGNTRAESVLNGVKYLENISAEDEDFVLVHDAARPCLRCSDLNLLMAHVNSDDVGGILAVPVSDTLKQANPNNVINRTIKRENIWRALTPQMIRLGILKKALLHCVESEITVTDEASAVEAIGLQVKLVKGHSDNIKITHQEDLGIATAILKNNKK